MKQLKLNFDKYVIWYKGGERVAMLSNRNAGMFDTVEEAKEYMIKHNVNDVYFDIKKYDPSMDKDLMVKKWLKN